MKVFFFYFKRNILKVVKKIQLFVDYIKFDLQSFDFYIFLIFFIYFFQFHTFDLI
jgi:hypothetical protein